MKLNQELLTEIIPAVAKKLEAWSRETRQFDFHEYAVWSKRRREADDRIVEFFTERYGARFSDRAAHDHSVTMARIRATSTGGWTSALQNWRRSAEKKLGAPR